SPRDGASDVANASAPGGERCARGSAQGARAPYRSHALGQGGTMSRISGVTMIVGSVPLEGPEDVFRACASALSPYLSAYPDGETGPRKYWTFSLASLIYSHHPDLEPVNAPAGGDVTQPGRDANQEDWNNSWWTFRLRDGVDSLTFDRLHY